MSVSVVSVLTVGPVVISHQVQREAQSSSDISPSLTFCVKSVVSDVSCPSCHLSQLAIGAASSHQVQKEKLRAPPTLLRHSVPSSFFGRVGSARERAVAILRLSRSHLRHLNDWKWSCCCDIANNCPLKIFLLCKERTLQMYSTFCGHSDL